MDLLIPLMPFLATVPIAVAAVVIAKMWRRRRDAPTAELEACESSSPSLLRRSTSGAGDQAEAELVRTTERERLRALVEADVGRARQLHADDFQLINPLGGALSKEQYLGGIGSGELDYLFWEPDSIVVRLYGETAVIRYPSHLEIVVQGRHIPRQRYWHTDLYERRDGQWQIVWSQATEIR